MENVTVRFTPLSGAHSSAPPSYLLEIGACKILLDCGWQQPYDVTALKPLSRISKEVDLVLLTHGNTEHAGALPYAVANFNLDCPVYCTTPVKTLGHMAMYDAYLAKHYNGDFTLFSPETIDQAWDKLQPLKFSQHLMLEGKAQGLEITPYAAGYSLGGCLWRIKLGMDEIVYCSHYNHTNERHLQKGLLSTLQRPMLLICGSSNANVVHADKRGDRDKQLLESVASTLRVGGNVLIPTDTSCRVLELALLLDTYWQAQRPLGCSLVLLSTQAYNMTSAAASLLEWMSERISKSFQSTNDSPFSLPTLHRCDNPDNLSQIPQPMLVLATMPDLESGFARELFAHWAHDEKNLVILADREQPNTLANRLAMACLENKPLDKVSLHLSKRIVLKGEELASYKRAKEIERLQELERERLEEAKKEMQEEAEDFDDGAEEELAQAAKEALQVVNPYFKNAAQHDLVLPVEKNAPFPMFPSTTAASDYLSKGVGEWSAYGTAIDASIFAPETEKENEQEEEEVQKQEIEEVPTKVEEYDLEIPINATVKYIGFEGKSDGKSLRNIIQAMMPRSAIFVRGSDADLEVMKNFAVQELQITRVLSPDIEQTVDASSDAQVYSAWLNEMMRSSLRWQVLDDVELAYLDGKVEGVEMIDNLERRVLRPVDAENTEDAEEQYDHTHRSIFIGQPALKDIKAILDKKGFRCAFENGVLVVNESINIKKEGGNASLLVEGAFNSDYFTVRDIVYSRFKTL